MPSGGVVEAFYEIKDGGACFCSGVVGVSVEQFCFQGGEERFCYSIVIGVSSAAPGRKDPGFLAAVSEGGGAILGGFKWWSQHLVRRRFVMSVVKRQQAIRAMRGQMWSPGRPSKAQREDRVRFWEAIAGGVSSEDAAGEAGVSPGGWVEMVPVGWWDAADLFGCGVGALSVVYRAGRDRPFLCAGCWGAGDRSPCGSLCVDDFAGVTAQRVNS